MVWPIAMRPNFADKPLNILISSQKHAHVVFCPNAQKQGDLEYMLKEDRNLNQFGGMLNFTLILQGNAPYG